MTLEGQVLAGKYKVERVLGQGGMGVVVSAMHLHLGQRVAIKFLHQQATQEVVARFLREARAAVRLKSEHVARVLDVGEFDNGAPYMVMEYLEGKDLSQVVHGQGPLPITEAIEHVLHACEAIAEAHCLGIVHRDLKPANLFLTKAADGSHTVKVLDFGISKTADGATEGDGMHLTQTTAVLGSPLYMSPEQLRSARDADVRSDIWALGVILYQLVTGTVPFNTSVFTDLIMMVNMQDPPPPSAHRAGIPPGLEAAILRCLYKKPDERFQNIGELAWAIVEYGPPDARISAERITRTLEGTGVRVSIPSISVSLTREQSSPSLSAPALTGLASTTPEPPRKKSPLVIGGLAAGLVVVAVATAVALRGRSTSPEAAAPPGVETVAVPTTAAAPPPLASAVAAPTASAVPAAAEATPIVMPTPSATPKAPASATARPAVQAKPAAQPAAKPPPSAAPAATTSKTAPDLTMPLK
jgi:serine/threonine protein kinase